MKRSISKISKSNKISSQSLVEIETLFSDTINEFDQYIQKILSKHKYMKSIMETIKDDCYLLGVSVVKAPKFRLSPDLIEITETNDMQHLYQNHNYKEHRSRLKTNTNFDSVSNLRRTMTKDMINNNNLSHYKDKMYHETMFYYVDLILLTYANESGILTRKQTNQLKTHVKTCFVKSFEEVYNIRITTSNRRGHNHSLLICRANSGDVSAQEKLTKEKENQCKRTKDCRSRK
jgi:hypothetical protein